MQDKKQIIGLILSVVLSVGLVVVGVNAATTVGNNVQVGGTTFSVGNLMVNGYATTTASNGDIATEGDLTITSTSTFNGDIILGSAAADSIVLNGTVIVNTGFASTTVTATTTMNGDIILGNASTDVIMLNGTLKVNAAFASTTVTATTTLNGDVLLGSAADDNVQVLGTIKSATLSVATTTLLSVGGGQMIAKHLTGTGSLDFPIITANTCASSTIGVTGAVSGDTVVLGVPNAFAITHSAASWSAYATSGLVVVRICNPSGASTPDFAAATFRADVWQH